MAIIYDNIIFSLQKAGGISAYWTELIKRLVKNNIDVTFLESDNSNIFRKYIVISTTKESRLSFKLLRYLPIKKKLPPKSIVHSSYFRTSKQSNVANVITVYDFTYEYFKSGIVKHIHTFQKYNAIRKADGIICISESTKKDLLKFVPEVTEDKVKTIYISASEEFHIIPDIEEKIKKTDFADLLEKKFLLYVGDRKSSYKNFQMAIDAAKILDDFFLIFVGAGDASHEELSVLDSKIPGRYRHINGVSSTELNYIYNKAFCLLYPSSYEGFGIPILEAMKAGCPVISTNVSSIPEVAGDAAILIDNLTADNLVSSVKKLEDDSFREEIINNGLIQQANFSWDQCYSETMKFYDKILRSKFGALNRP